ncbi:MAG: alpha/beta hydrolase [Acidobacteria bacterium]|nr:alpha/beta hydrolase [Acidobacteriota bacterium]
MFHKAGRYFTGLMILSMLLPAIAGADNKLRERKEEVGDIKIRYLEAGSGDKIIVFLTGWTMTAEVWKDQFAYFTARGFRVIAFDPRSQGETTKTETGNTYQQHAADLYELLLELKAEHSFLVAWSSGVTTLLEYTSSPDSIRPNKIILVDGFPAAFEKDDYPGATTLSQVRSDFLEIQQDRKKFTEKFVQGLFKQPQTASLIKNLNKSSLETPVGAAVSLLFDLVTGDRLPALESISVPTLIITTRENRAVGEYMNSKISRSELKIIEDAGHAIFLDKPQTFNQAVETFIGEY